jgi:hypothetical protein
VDRLHFKNHKSCTYGYDLGYWPEETPLISHTQMQKVGTGCMSERLVSCVPERLLSCVTERLSCMSERLLLCVPERLLPCVTERLSCVCVQVRSEASQLQVDVSRFAPILFRNFNSQVGDAVAVVMRWRWTWW